MGIGIKLSNLLTERNMTVAELAKRIDVAPTTIYSIIQRNNKKVDIDVLLDIAEVLNVEAEYFRDSPRTQTIAAHKDEENFTADELEKIEEYKKLLIAARPKE